MQKSCIQKETIQRLCAQRKTQNFQYLKQWDLRRAKKLMLHRKLIDQFQISIQNKNIQSNTYIDVVRQFLTDLLTQKIKYELQMVDNPETKIKNTLAGQIIHKNASKALGKLYNMTNNYKGYKRLKQILEIGLQKVQKLLNQNNFKLMEIKTKIQLKALELQDSNSKTLEFCNNIITIYQKDKKSKPFLTQNDLYVRQQQFIFEAYMQTKLQRQLGEIIVSYLQFVEQLQKKKLALIKQVIGSYLYGMKQENNDPEHLNSLKDILKKQTQHKYINQLYSVDQLIPITMISQLAKYECKHPKELDMKFLKRYLTKYSIKYLRLAFEPFQMINYLILKEYHIFLKDNGELHEIKLLITVDAFLNIYLKEKQVEINNSQQNLDKETDYSVKIDSNLKMEIQGDISLVLKTKKIKKQRNSNNLQPGSIQLIFSNEDQRQQFIEFTEKIMK